MNPNIILYPNEIQINNITQIKDFNDDVFNVIINDELFEIKGNNLVLKEVFNDNKSITVIGTVYMISKSNEKKKEKKSFIKKLLA